MLFVIPGIQISFNKCFIPRLLILNAYDNITIWNGINSFNKYNNLYQSRQQIILRIVIAWHILLSLARCILDSRYFDETDE